MPTSDYLLGLHNPDLWPADLFPKVQTFARVLESGQLVEDIGKYVLVVPDGVSPAFDTPYEATEAALENGWEHAMIMRVGRYPRQEVGTFGVVGTMAVAPSRLKFDGSAMAAANAMGYETRVGRWQVDAVLAFGDTPFESDARQRCMLDIGADCTMVASRRASALPLPKEPREFEGASGIGMAQYAYFTKARPLSIALRQRVDAASEWESLPPILVSMVAFRELPCTSPEDPAELEWLIGRDVIAQCDCTITWVDGKAVFTLNRGPAQIAVRQAPAVSSFGRTLTARADALATRVYRDLRSLLRK